MSPDGTATVDIAGVALTPEEIAVLPPRLAAVVRRRLRDVEASEVKTPESVPSRR